MENLFKNLLDRLGRRPSHHLENDMRAIAEAMAIDASARHYVWPMRSALGIRPGRIHVALARMERLGAVTSGWDDEPGMRLDQSRRWYRLTPAGLEVVLKMRKERTGGG